MNSARRIAGVLAAFLLLTACSATKVAYNNLDWLAQWRVDDYIDLHGPTETLFEQRFAVIWKWHRKTQLPLYVADLRELSKAVAQPLSVEQCESYLDRAQAHADVIIEKALPDWTEFLASLSDEQVEGFLKKLRQKQREAEEEIAEGEDWDRREKRLEKMLEGIDRWLGSVTPEQEERANQWADQLRYEPELRFQLRKESTAAFQDLMRDRRSPDFPSRLARLIDGQKFPSSDAVDELFEHNTRVGLAMLSDLTGMMTPDQRKHLRAEIRELADDLESLAAQPTN